MWASGHSADSIKRAAHGYEPTREAAMAVFAKSWRRCQPPIESLTLGGFIEQIFGVNEQFRGQG
jgi:hypothetical protein